MIEFDGRQIPNELKEIVDPKRTVLLVWDMQNDQAGGSFNKDALIRTRRRSSPPQPRPASRPFTRARRRFSGAKRRSPGFAER